MGARPIGLLLAAGLLGCGTRPCKEGTVQLALVFDPVAAAADALRFRVSVDGGTKTSEVARAPGRGDDTVTISFASGYPANRAVTVEVTALLRGAAGSFRLESLPSQNSFQFRGSLPRLGTMRFVDDDRAASSLQYAGPVLAALLRHLYQLARNERKLL